MNTLLISYDLIGNENSDAYKTLIDQIKKFSPRAKPLESFWLVKTDLNSSDMRDLLGSYIDANDKLLIINVTGQGWASKKLDPEVTAWMKNHM